MNSYDSVPSLGVARAATERSHFLAESPVWDPIRGRVLWVDILDGAVYGGRLTDRGRLEVDERFDFPDTAGAVAVSGAGELVVAGAHRLHHRAADGQVRSGRRLVEGADRRLNDGKPDPMGRFVVGSKGPGPEVLLRLDGEDRGDGEGGETVTILDDDLTLSNGLAWSVDGSRLYSVDTLRRRIHVRDYHAASGAVGRRDVFAQLENGYPDGLATDRDDHLWVAMWGEGCVLRISASGQLVGRIDVPAPHTSCPAFVGPDLDTLVITTAKEGLTPAQLDEHPASGRLFTIRSGHRGSPAHLWQGTTSRTPLSEGNS